MRDGRGVGESGKKISPDFKLATDVVFADDVEVGADEVGNFCFESLSLFLPKCLVFKNRAEFFFLVFQVHLE